MSYRQAYTELEGQFTTMVASTASGNTASFGASEIGNAELADNAGSGLKISPGFPVAAAGSPAAVGVSIYAGDSTTGAGSDAWVVYPGVVFAAAPKIVCQNTKQAGATFFVPTGSTGVGSFYVQSSAASSTFNYYAIGSGRSP